ncbi:MAG TPA: hypothetical protein VHX60_04050 [Acidobacteriaceae bacterium]|jgi:hypothetical protein|nr:hypothetical protein [Acidobacteriaceae bacterium]
MAANWGASRWKSIPKTAPRKLIAENFQGSIGGVRECIDALEDPLPRGTESESFATYVRAIMNGALTLLRSYGSGEPFDRTVKQPREHFRLLLGESGQSKTPHAPRTRRRGCNPV